MQTNRTNQYVEDLIGNKAIPDNKWMLMASSGRLGAILLNVSVILLLLGIAMALAVALSAVVMFMVYLVWLLIILLAIIFTLGLILLAESEELDQLFSFTDSTADMLEWIVRVTEVAAPYVFLFAFLTGLTAIAFLALDRTKKHSVRLIFASVISVIGLIAAVCIFASGGAA